MAENGEWYGDGLRFECTQCGNCCTGPPGYVSFTDEEAAGLAALLEISIEEFLARFTHVVRGRRSLRERLTRHGYDCVFLDRESQPGRAVCSVYSARPTQCRTWPFWPEYLADAETWRRTGERCPGIGKGALVPVEAIRIERDRTPG